MAKSRKSFPLRMSEELYNDLRGWADQEMRSINAQIEFLLREAVKRRKKANPPGGPTRSAKRTKKRKPDS